MFSKINNGTQPYQISHASDANNNLTTTPQHVAKANFNQHQQNNASNGNCEIRSMDEEEDDVDSLNINFDDVNEQSDMEEYYNNCSSQVLNSTNVTNQINNNLSKSDNCLYDNQQQNFILNPKILASQINNSNKQQIMNNRINHCSYPSSSASSSPNSILDSVIGNEISSPIETGFGVSNPSKANNKNIHCVKEKIRRDRIKVSCNQLRKLIPNVNGLKTDMASLLETSVYWAELINTYVPDQYLNIIKSKLTTLATMKINGQMKSMHVNSNVSTQKYKPNFEYLLAKNQQEVMQHIQSDMHNGQNNSPPSSISSSVNQYDSLPIDINHSFNPLPPSLNLKPNSWLPYSFQLNNETNNYNNMNQVSHHHHMMAYNEFYDKIIKKSPSNSNFNYER